MSSRLTSLKVVNYRSIRGTHTVNLDAPVVLIHGSNGSGKTSLLSAIELGLTGAASAMRRVDSDYADHLVHTGAKNASIKVRCTQDATQAANKEITIQNGALTGSPVLSTELGRFYTERCFLAQATLGRLLEIYEDKDTRRSDTPLMRFVKDLLGLDHFDGLLKGLHHVRDIRRLQNELPVYRDVELDEQRLKAEISKVEQLLQTEKEALELLEQTLNDQLVSAEIDQHILFKDLPGALSTAAVKANSERLEGIRRELSAAQSLWSELSESFNSQRLKESQEKAAQAENAWNDWDASNRVSVEAALAFSARLVPNLPSADGIGFGKAVADAMAAVSRELVRAKERRASDQETTDKLVAARSDSEKAAGRVARLEKRLEQLSEGSGSLARALAEIEPFVSGDICPVCLRDFSETGDEPLHAHLTSHISKLAKAAEDLREATRQRQAESRGRDIALTAIADLEARRLTPESLAELLKRISELEEAQESLESVFPQAERGGILRAQYRDASEFLNTLRRAERTLHGLRESISEFPIKIGIAPQQKSEGIGETLSRCVESLAVQIEATGLRITMLSNASETFHEVAAQRIQVDALSKRRSALIEQKTRVSDAFASANATRDEARKLALRVEEVRTEIVRRVFNENLNDMWRDLFVRLAPDEAFVPAFSIPAPGRGPVEVKLETRLRDGEVSGHPRSILSAGNLNTAALTLFLSLHLSVKPVLPWLVIDDPVQSMDEIHTAQFAALLRTLSRQGGRQIIIAVHEKPLFDYLALELTPASAHDRLITIELSREEGKDTEIIPNIITWNPDVVLTPEYAQTA